MPCNPSDVSIPIPTDPTVPQIPGFGQPFALKLDDIAPFPDGFPEDLLDLFEKFQLLIPPGIIKPGLSKNFSKDVFDTIMSLLDKFFPFLMLYKFFLPVLNLIICIIEVLCAIPNPFKLIRALKRLFRNCIPAFLNLFPVFALIVMIISLLLLILALIEYIIAQILKFINALLRNINALARSFEEANQNSVLAIAKKIGSLLCIFQNLFVLLGLFNIIIQVIRDMLNVIFSIPPCEEGNPSDTDKCCTPDVCPDIVKTDYTRTTGNLRYFNRAAIQTNVILPAPLSSLNVDIREESWQIYDLQQEIPQEFINIVDAYDVVGFNPKPVFFPVDSTYNALTAPNQAAYTVDLRILYNPASWGRTGTTRYIRFKNCIVILAPTRNLYTYNNGIQTVNKGVLKLAGGLGYEDDGTTVLTGFADDGVTTISGQATLENFLHKPALIDPNPVLTPFDGYFYSNIEYTFKPNRETLLRKQLITLGCEPSLAEDRAFVNNIIAGDIGLKTQLLSNLINNPGGTNPATPETAAFPDPNAAQQCLATAISALRSNLTPEGVAEFQATANICLNKLKDDTNAALGAMIGIGFDACSSDFSINPNIQFTTKSIDVSVNLKEKNGVSLITGIPADIASSLAPRIKAYSTFGEISDFSYDGYGLFNAKITSQSAGSGTLMISFDDNIFCNNNIPQDIDVSATHTLKVLDYSFVYSPGSITTGAGDTSDKPRRDETDVSNNKS